MLLASISAIYLCCPVHRSKSTIVSVHLIKSWHNSTSILARHALSKEVLCFCVSGRCDAELRMAMKV